MKRLITLVLGAAVAFSAAAQNWQDGLLFSENNYIGTARGVGMGNALTAVGGDAGSLTFNPAGSAVASYSQFFITPGLSFSALRSEGTEASPDYDADPFTTNFARFKVPNVGFIMNYDRGRRSGWKSFAFGFAVNGTNDYTSRFNSAGVNFDNSYAASLATSALGFSADDLGSGDWFYTGDPARMPSWAAMTGFRSGMFNTVNEEDGNYVALTEVLDDDGNIRIAAPLYQQYGRQITGHKSDIIFNFAANYNDVLYLGANMGVVALSYNMAEYWKEEPNNPSEFPAIEYSDGSSATFNSLLMKRSFSASGGGLYLKAGVLWRPIAGLRVGAAIQTPTLMDITERYGYLGSVDLGGKSTQPIPSAEDEWRYSITSPARYNFGLAYSFGSLALVSVDYELANMGGIRYSSYSSNSDNSYFDDVNADINAFLGLSHQLRAGVEVKPIPALALRAGFNYITSGDKNLDFAKTNYSLGLGYSSGGPFFMDFAVRLRRVDGEYLTPYFYYKEADGGHFYDKVVDADVLTPEVHVTSTLADAMLTLGWRF